MQKHSLLFNIPYEAMLWLFSVYPEFYLGMQQLTLIPLDTSTSHYNLAFINFATLTFSNNSPMHVPAALSADGTNCRSGGSLGSSSQQCSSPRSGAAGGYPPGNAQYIIEPKNEKCANNTPHLWHVGCNSFDTIWRSVHLSRSPE